MKAVAEYNTLTADMLARCGRKPTDEEACQFLDITNEQLQRTHKAIQFKNIKSLNIPLSDGTELELCELISADTDVEGEVLDVVELQELKSLLWDMVARLPTGQAQIIESRYIDNKTVREISSETGESETDVKREEKRALHTLSHCKGSNRLVSFLPECVEYSEGLKGTSVKTFNRTWTSATERVSIQLAKCR
jgi:RNA polymerase sigma factor (sigma-70 family)